VELKKKLKMHCFVFLSHAPPFCKLFASLSWFEFGGQLLLGTGGHLFLVYKVRCKGVLVWVV